MPNYKASRGIHYKIYSASDQQEAEQIAAQFGTGWVVEPTNEQIEPQSNEDKVSQDLDFGISLIKLFRTDNADYEQANNVTITVAESVALMQKFQSLIGFCQVGAISEAYALLPGIEIDAIFTQERKDKYLSTIQNYLGL
jgi:hypothetical protein